MPHFIEPSGYPPTSRVVGEVAIIEEDGDVVLLRHWREGHSVDGTDMIGLFQAWRGKTVEVVIAPKGTEITLRDRLVRTIREKAIAEWRARADVVTDTQTRALLRMVAHELEGLL